MLRKSKKLLLILISVLTLAFGCGDSLTEDELEAQVKPFEAHLSEYTSAPDPKNTSLTEAPYIVGKVIPLRRGEYEIHWMGARAGFPRGSYTELGKPEDAIDEFYSELPTELRARTPEEVKTVIWLEWTRNVVGRYTSGAEAHQFKCTLSVIDRTRNAMIGQKTFYGANPPEKTSNVTFGTLPLDEILQYVTSLPRRY